jgi:hypothetical protein
VSATSAGDQVSRSAVSRGAVSRSAQKCPEASGPVVRRPETALGADATELFDRPVRLAEMVLGTSPGSVTVAGLGSDSGLRKPAIPDLADRQSVL